MVQLIDMTDEEFGSFLQHNIAKYAESNIRANNWTEDEAAQKSREVHTQLLPDGRSTAGHYFFSIRKAGEPMIGRIWMAVERRSGVSIGVIYDLYIDDNFRRQGIAMQALSLLEDKARKLNVSVLSLNVFADNQAAISLYEKVGYGITRIAMSKSIQI